jgi:phosphoribosylformylglycinamidine (FGAM) synthase-like amidotransferase family enzyme
MAPHVLVLRAPGANCDVETAHAFSLAGAAPERWHVRRLLEEPKRVAEFQIFCIPGGFAYGDDLAAGRILGSQMRHHLADVLREFHEAGKLILGICNGFQVLMNTDLLTPPDAKGPVATLAVNDSGHLECRWVRLGVDGSKCVFLSGIQEMQLPVAHGEGKFVVRDEEVMRRLEAAGQVVLRYKATADCGTQRVPGIADSTIQSEIRNPKSEISSVPYPDNPNGALGNIAGICDATGRVFGLMPHPERFVDPTQHPQWTRRPAQEAGHGLRVFQNAVRYFL